MTYNVLNVDGDVKPYSLTHSLPNLARYFHINWPIFSFILSFIYSRQVGLYQKEKYDNITNILKIKVITHYRD